MSDWWDKVYEGDTAPWDIGRPQPAISQLAESGDIRSPVLDSGCGSGEHAILFASRGLEVIGVDIASPAIDLARRKAAERGVTVDFRVGDSLHLERLDRRFATVIDSGVFHVFDDADRARYVGSLASVIEPAGALHLLCFSELTPGNVGPRRVTQDELRAAFADGWDVDAIGAARFEVRGDLFATRPHAWLARIVRAPAQA